MTGRPYILAETTWKTVSKTDYEVAILPWGATEAHNYHLPYGTDVLESESIAGAAAGKAWDRGARVVVLPTVPFGVNTSQIDIKLDINMNPSTQLAVLRDIVDVLEHQKIPKLVILNGHGGNDFRQMLRELWPHYRIFMCTLDWYKFVDRSLFQETGDHADEMETSLIQHIRPDWALPLSEAGDGKERKFKIKGLREGLAWSPRDWVQATADTGIGDPRAATPEKGERCLEGLADRIGEFLVELAEAAPEDLYEDGE